VEQDEKRSPRYDELERALSSVPGIVTASIVVSDETGRGRLRIRLAPGEDPDAVSWAVAATLRERFGIALDPETIRPRLDHETADHEKTADHETADHEPAADAADTVDVSPGSAAEAIMARSNGGRPTQAPSPIDVAEAGIAGGSDARVRAAIRDLVTRQGDRDVEVTATLEVGDRRGRSVARAIPTRRGVWRAVAEATIGALGELTGDQLQAGVDRVAVSSQDDPAMATVLVSVLSDRGEETLLGASLVRDDPEGAVMRATLDALNRRVEPWLLGS
jgi:hypothetical protein